MKTPPRFYATAVALLSSRVYYMRIPQYGMLLLRLLFTEKIQAAAQTSWFKVLFGHAFTSILEHGNPFPRSGVLLLGTSSLYASIYCRLQQQGKLPHHPALNNFMALLGVIQFVIMESQVVIDGLMRPCIQ